VTHRSNVRAGALLLEDIRFTGLGREVHHALEVYGQYEPKVAMTRRDTGATSREYGDYILATIEDSNLVAKWEEYVSAE
jgi:hypothetical protein